MSLQHPSEEGTTCLWFHPKSVTALLFSSTLPPAPRALWRPLSGAPGPHPLPLWPGLLCGRGVPACQAPLSSPSSPGAVSVGRQERVSLILVWDLTDAPSLSRAQGLVSPVVACGPHGASFLKPCTLTFKHCAQQPSQARTYSSNTALLDAKAWKPLGRPGDHTSRDECRIHLSHFRWVPACGPGLPAPVSACLVLTSLRGLPLMLSKLACKARISHPSPLPLSQCLWLLILLPPHPGLCIPHGPSVCLERPGSAPVIYLEGPVPSPPLSLTLSVSSLCPGSGLSPRCPGHVAPSSSLRLHPRLCLSLALSF